MSELINKLSLTYQYDRWSTIEHYYQVWLSSVLLHEIFLTSISQVYHSVENKARKVSQIQIYKLMI